MFSGKDAANPAYPTQWALNPTAYQNVDSSTVDWAALAQQWIAMKEAAAIITAPPPPSLKNDAEEGEAPMEVENTDGNSENSAPPGGAEYNATTNSWGGSWNQWGWGWPEGTNIDSKVASDPTVDGYAVPVEGSSPLPGYNTGSAPTFQHGYWTASQVDQTGGRSRSRDKRAKSKNQDHKSNRPRPPRDKASIPPIIEPIVMPTPVSPTIDAAKRRQLPGWIREGLEKMEREKQRAIEREEEQKAREEAEKEKKRLEEEELERMKAEAGGQPVAPAKSKFETDSEGDSDKEEETSVPTPRSRDTGEDTQVTAEDKEDPPPLVRKSKEEIMHEVMLTVRRSLTEILLEVTDQEIDTVSQEELARYTAAQASRLNAMKASKSKALASIASGLGLGAYESSSEESGGEDEVEEITDQQLQDIIRRKKNEFERTSREIEAEVRRAEQREAEEVTPAATPERPRRSRSSATPPPLEGETPEKVPERRVSKDKRNNQKSNDKVDGVKKLEVIHEERAKKVNRKDHTPSPPKNNKSNQKENSTTSDSEEDSSSTSSQSSSESETEVKVEVKTKKRKRKSSSSSESQRKSKKEKHKREKFHKDERNSNKLKHHDSYYDSHKSSKSKDYEKAHKDKYRDGSEDDRPRKRRKRSRTNESRLGRRRSRERSRRRDKRSYDRESSKRERSYDRSGRDHDKYDRYERSRDDRRRSRSTSRSRHRR